MHPIPDACTQKFELFLKSKFLHHQVPEVGGIMFLFGENFSLRILGKKFGQNLDDISAHLTSKFDEDHVFGQKFARELISDYFLNQNVHQCHFLRSCAKVRKKICLHSKYSLIRRSG